MKTCRGCSQSKPTSDYPLRGRGTNRRNTKPSPYCNGCTFRFERDRVLNGGRSNV